MTFTRRGLLQASVAVGAAAGGLATHRASAQGTVPYGLEPGKPHAGTRLSVLLPQATQYRAQEKRLPEFRELTGIEVAYSYVPYSQLRDKIITEAVAGSSAFDVVNYQDSWGTSLATYLQPLDEWLGRDGVAMDGYPPAYRMGSMVEGRTYGLPIRGHPQMLFYRKDLLEQAGVQPPRTWDELVAAADAVQKKTGTAGVAMYYGKGNGGQNLFLWLNYLWGGGSDIFTPDYKSTRFNEPAGVEATQMYLDLLLRHQVAAPGSVQFLEQDAVNSVAQGNSAMVMVWWWVYSVLTGSTSTLKPEQVGFASMPTYPSGKPATYALSLPFAVSALSGKKDAAWEFMKWVSNPDLEVAIVTDKSDPATTDIVATHLSTFRDERVNEVNGGLHKAALASLEGSRIMPQLKEWPQVAEVLESTISELAGTGGSVKDGLDNAASQVDRILRRAGTRRG